MRNASLICSRKIVPAPPWMAIAKGCVMTCVLQ
ncbi:Uncharacterised protein [Vibrio cholerae]|nr:Uncharacterised protein [Vibrio cholerae]